MLCQNGKGYAYTVESKDDFVYELGLHGEVFWA